MRNPFHRHQWKFVDYDKTNILNPNVPKGDTVLISFQDAVKYAYPNYNSSFFFGSGPIIINRSGKYGENYVCKKCGSKGFRSAGVSCLAQTHQLLGGGDGIYEVKR